MSTLIKNCENCGIEIKVRKVDVNRGHGKFCSRKCNAQASSKKRKPKEYNQICNNCGVSFYRNSTKVKNSKSGLQFCTRKCKDIGQRIESGLVEIHPHHYKNGHYAKYRIKALSDLPNQCNRCPVTNFKTLIVHHKDHNRKNNNLSNLEIICANCHMIEHFGGG